MPFIGVHRETGQRLDITAVEQPRRVLKSGEWVCQLCGASLVVKAGLVVRPHFAHYAAAECRTDYRYHPESPAHREAKSHLAGLLRQHYAEYTDAQIEYEVPIPEVKRVADILIVFPMGWRVAHEVQLAAISLAELQERTEEYERAGIDVVWWLGKAADTQSNRLWCIQTCGQCYTINPPAELVETALVPGRSETAGDANGGVA